MVAELENNPCGCCGGHCSRNHYFCLKCMSSLRRGCSYICIECGAKRSHPSATETCTKHLKAAQGRRQLRLRMLSRRLAGSPPMESIQRGANSPCWTGGRIVNCSHCGKNMGWHSPARFPAGLPRCAACHRSDAIAKRAVELESRRRPGRPRKYPLGPHLPKAVPANRICPRCAKSFHPTCIHSIYCGKACNRAMAKRRSRQRKRAKNEVV